MLLICHFYALTLLPLYSFLLKPPLPLYTKAPFNDL